MVKELRNLQERPLASFPLADKLNQYFLNLSRVFKHEEPEEREQRRILTIIERNDQIANLLNREEYQAVLTEENALKGSCKVGVVLCIDGRIPIVHQFGRALNAWEVAGSLIGLKNETIGPVAQDHNLATKAPKLKKSLGNIKWEKSRVLKFIFY